MLSGSATTIRNNVVADLQREVEALTDPVPEKFVREFQISTIFHPPSEEFFKGVLRETMMLPARV